MGDPIVNFLSMKVFKNYEKKYSGSAFKFYQKMAFFPPAKSLHGVQSPLAPKKNNF